MLSEWKIEPGHQAAHPLRQSLCDGGRGIDFRTRSVAGNDGPCPGRQHTDVEFIANNPADWAIHCHMTHHVMNQMGHRLPNIVGIEPGKLDKQVRASCPAT
jgi:hypothetical protein